LVWCFFLGGGGLDAAGREIRARADELSVRLAGQTTTTTEEEAHG
jgi:hypothetical protein